VQAWAESVAKANLKSIIFSASMGGISR